ncbi:unnamed protein product [Candida verbasci]|uniref:Diphosphomevalonate decarboxylase n=1 Tax=Candida verbasci TaxID=1227364 RepID=A0A9W4XL38_9ASCO|nr:unnamed protein product [Candida verbasci]
MIYSSVSSPVNIATLKYWGKRDSKLNLPTNSSISVTLSQNDLKTTTTAYASSEFNEDRLFLNGKLESLDSERTQACLLDLRTLRKQYKDDGVAELKLTIVSENNFPTAAGLASSAAGFAALIYSIAKLYDLPSDLSELSKIARKGSGSACRSLFGGFVAWEMGEKEDGSDSKAVEIAPISHWPSLKAIILIVSDDKKDTPSTVGMQTTVKTSDLFQYRIREVVPKRFEEMKQAILDKDFPSFAELTMKDSNSFHSVCLDSYPPIFYLNDVSKHCIKIVQDINKEEIIAAYTFDAGPNCVVYYDEKDEDKVLGEVYKYYGNVNGWGNKKYEITNERSGINRVILTSIGDGVKEIEEILSIPN